MNVPRVIPRRIEMIDEAPPDPGSSGVPGGTGVPGATGVAGAIANLLAAAVLAPPAPAPATRPLPKSLPPAEPARVKIGGVVLAGKLISQTEPQYPEIARRMRIQGVVELLAVVGTDGHIRELKLISGNPLLAPAALDAVNRWIYRPTFLNGDAVEIMAPVTVTFRLN